MKSGFDVQYNRFQLTNKKISRLTIVVNCCSIFETWTSSTEESLINEKICRAIVINESVHCQSKVRQMYFYSDLVLPMLICNQTNMARRNNRNI